VNPAVALAVVLHGLEGSASSGYALETYRRLAAQGIAAVGLNFRSCSGTLNRACRLYHSGETDDLRYVVRTLRARLPHAQLGAVGFSLGGNVLLKYLGEEGLRGQGGPEGQQRQEIVAAVAISVPYDLAAGARHMEQGLTRLYVRRLLRSLKRKVRARMADLGAGMDVPRALTARSFWEFDDAATAPLHGFRDAADYYAQSSSAGYLGVIRVPVRLVHAADDPFLPGAALPRAAVAANPRLDAWFVPHGGHVGFVSGPPWRTVYWAETLAASFLGRALRPLGDQVAREDAAPPSGRSR
jgi:predicted alpha/beta-fold hydrolase